MLSLVKQVTFALVLHGVLEGVADDFLAAGTGDDLEGDDLVGCGLILDTRVEILFVFADDDDVHAGMLGADERVIRHARPDVGVEAEHLARGDVEALVAAALRGGDGSFQEHLGAAQRIPGAGRDAGGVAGEVNLLADFDGVDFKGCAGLLEDVQRGGHDFGADAVAMGDGDGVLEWACFRGELTRLADGQGFVNDQWEWTIFH